MTTGKIIIGKVSLTPQPNPIKKDASNKFLIFPFSSIKYL